MQLEQLKFPIGIYSTPETITPELLSNAIDSLEFFPARLKEATQGFTEEQFLTPYRPGGWTVQQLINHCADSHMNSLIRFKWCLTEDTPKIKTYDQDKWANLPDSENIPVDFAFQMLEGIHGRLTYLLKSLDEVALNRNFFHPEMQRNISIKENICLYAWHSEHHLAHVTELKKRMEW